MDFAAFGLMFKISNPNTRRFTCWGNLYFAIRRPGSSDVKSPWYFGRWRLACFWAGFVRWQLSSKTTGIDGFQKGVRKKPGQKSGVVGILHGSGRRNENSYWKADNRVIRKIEAIQSPRTPTMHWFFTHQTFSRKQRQISRGCSVVVLTCCSSGISR